MKKVVVAYAMAEETDLENLQPVIEKGGLYRLSKRLDGMFSFFRSPDPKGHGIFCHHLAWRCPPSV